MNNETKKLKKLNNFFGGKGRRGMSQSEEDNRIQVEKRYRKVSS